MSRARTSSPCRSASISRRRSKSASSRAGPASWRRPSTLEAYRANLRLLDRLLQMLRMQEPFTGGAIMVAAAGNDSSRGADGEYIMSACPPSGSDKIVSVGSLDPDPLGRRLSRVELLEQRREITAPGRGIASAAPGGGLKVLSGTSVAAPHVAGVAALWWQAVRQSDLPANATLVRGILWRGAERGLFAGGLPGRARAGRAFAPRRNCHHRRARPSGRFGTSTVRRRSRLSRRRPHAPPKSPNRWAGFGGRRRRRLRMVPAGAGFADGLSRFGHARGS